MLQPAMWRRPPADVQLASARGADAGDIVAKATQLYAQAGADGWADTWCRCAAVVA